MTAFLRRGKAERTTPCRKASVAACGRQPYRQDNDTPALNALTALRGAPTSMGRGETPVELLKKDNLLRYSMQLAFLKQLLEKKLISDREYSLIKSRLMKDYKIVSDLLS